MSVHSYNIGQQIHWRYSFSQILINLGDTGVSAYGGKYFSMEDSSHATLLTASHFLTLNQPRTHKMCPEPP